MARYSATELISAKSIFVNPFFLIEKFSLLAMRSSPMNVRMNGLRIRATGTMAAVLSPISPSEIQSTASPVTNAMSRHKGVPVVSGMQRIMAGSSESIT